MNNDPITNVEQGLELYWGNQLGLQADFWENKAQMAKDISLTLQDNAGRLHSRVDRVSQGNELGHETEARIGQAGEYFAVATDGSPANAADSLRANHQATTTAMRDMRAAGQESQRLLAEGIAMMRQAAELIGQAGIRATVAKDAANSAESAASRTIDAAGEYREHLRGLIG